MKEAAAAGGPPFCSRLNQSSLGPGGANDTDGRWEAAGEHCGSVSVAYSISMMLAGLAGNALAMLLVGRSYRRKESRRGRAFLLCLGGLALTDMTGQLLTSPVVIAVYLSRRSWNHLDPSGRLCTFFGLSMTMFGLCPLFLAGAMAVERALAIRAPHWYAGHLQARAARAVLPAVWLAGLAFALLPVAGVGRYSVQWPGTWCFISPGAASGSGRGDVFFATTFACLGLAALAVTFACNLATVAALVARCRAKAVAAPAGARWGRITTETVIQLLGITCVLSACWTPLLILMLKMIFSHTSMDHCKTLGFHGERPKECDFFLTAIRLASLNQILDPWVYLLLRKILLRKFCQGEETHWRQDIHWEVERDSLRTNLDEPGPRSIQKNGFLEEKSASEGFLCARETYRLWTLPRSLPFELPAQPSQPSWQVIPMEKGTALSTSHTQDGKASLAETAGHPERETGGREDKTSQTTISSSKILMEVAQDPDPEKLRNGQVSSPASSTITLGSSP
ncbi:prostaglandin E2 receptor EP3 subtype isoform X2 [Monodelphis domestica]|uniref:prostaglandin E2 receptor EP3 subtype isoform X2 n=1 Tax=Monodelphis domestica TaxID=13616 RepID=UPI0024E1EA8F|nr:prostaglandin E2 receptor EP3 subtype isoform X2 [Monodelphis domestica]